MIKRKLKICKECKLPKFIFSKGLCSFCYGIVNKPQIKVNSAVKSVSERGKERNEKYNSLRTPYMQEHPMCEICNINESQDLHHRSGRQGENMFKDFMAVCRECHNYLHSHYEEAVEKGWIIPQNK